MIRCLQVVWATLFVRLTQIIKLSLYLKKRWRFFLVPAVCLCNWDNTNVFKAVILNSEARFILIQQPFSLLVSKIHLTLFFCTIIYITKLYRDRTKLICYPSNRNEVKSQKRRMFSSNTHCFWLKNVSKLFGHWIFFFVKD